MSCEITYKGDDGKEVTYKFSEFASMLHNGHLKTLIDQGLVDKKTLKGNIDLLVNKRPALTEQAKRNNAYDMGEAIGNFMGSMTEARKAAKEVSKTERRGSLSEVRSGIKDIVAKATEHFGGKLSSKQMNSIVYKCYITLFRIP